ncbi:glycoside hydrolase family 127 protein [Oerskovia flava]|uniref:glycoside hydrolase family 127 protein n=1 Tax=Oerskovia flava TaxID=2986422 RepID=UPI002240BE02|nr:glycoside hydrolase family 127 protein [Oerskovia sp. JB1-3-2]
MEPFDLSDVRLLDGPFRDAQRTGLEYLLRLDPDRLLAPLRREAGLAPVVRDGDPVGSYGNWEDSGLDGHTLGHALSAAALMSAATDDPRPRVLLDRLVAGVAQCQDALGTGYVGGVPDGQRLWDRVVGVEAEAQAGTFELGGAWVPWYNLHKLFAGLVDAYRQAGSRAALDVVVRLADWWCAASRDLDDDRFEAMLATEHGGMTEAYADLAAITGRDEYLTMARRFAHRAVLEPLAARRDALDGLHANTQIPKVVGYQRLGELTQDEELLGAARFFWETVTRRRTYAFGGNSVREHFHPAHDCSPALASPEGPETCNTTNMLRLSRAMFLHRPDPEIVDFYERATFNHILSSQHPRGGFVYFTPVRPDHYRVYSQPQECFWCCVGTGLENHARYGELVCSRSADALWVHLFVASTVRWAERGVTLEQRTRFPADDAVELTVRAAAPVGFTLRVRRPGWLEPGARVDLAVNGARVAEVLVDGYLEIRRTWHDGDRVTFTLPAAVSAERLPDGSDWVAFRHGPVVLAARTTADDLVGLVADEARMGHVAGGPLHPLAGLPVVLTECDDDLPGTVHRLPGEPLAYVLERADDPAGRVTVLEPFAGIHDARYVLYWPLAAPGAVPGVRAALRARDDAELAESRATVDVVHAGQQQPESDHAFTGEQTSTGTVEGVGWRSATGWFGYRLSDPHGHGRALRITYRPGTTPTAVRLDGAPVAELDAQEEPPTGPRVVEIPLPDGAGSRAGVEVRLEATAGGRTAQVVEVRLVS